MGVGIDVSSYQDPADWLLNDREFCIIKATEGTSYTNPNRGEWYQVARGRGVTVGGYHFMSAGDPGAQAAYYLGHLPGDVDWHALDVENNGDGLDWSGRVRFILDWCGRVAAATGKPTIVYANRSWAVSLWNAANPDQRAQLATYGLWIADYTGQGGQYSGACPDGWPIVIHQYTSTPVDTNLQITSIKGTDMPLNDDDLRNIYQAVWFGRPGADLVPNLQLGQGEWPSTLLGAMTRRVCTEQLAPQIGAIQGQLAGITEAIAQITSGSGIDQEAIKAAATEGAKAGVQAVIDSATVTLDAGGAA